MKVVLYADEYFPFYYVRPKERALNPSDIRDIPKDLYDRNEAIMVQFEAIQRELRAIDDKVKWEVV